MQRLPEPRGLAPAPTRSTIDLLVVSAGEQRCGFLARDVVEVQRLVAWEPLPGAPEAVEGVIDLRGQVVPVLDLHERLQQTPRPPRLTDHLVIARARGHLVAARVAVAIGIEAIAAEQLTATEHVVPTGERVRGVARLPQSLLVIVDLDAFLGWDEAEQLTSALECRVQGSPDG